VPGLRFLDSARDDLAEIASYIAMSGGADAAVRFTGEIIAKCEYLASLAGLLGRARPELRPDVRSVSFKGYLIFFRYLPSNSDRDILEIVNVLEGHRDLVAYFSDSD
jgi:toxin ParE1/3/4